MASARAGQQHAAAEDPHEQALLDLIAGRLPRAGILDVETLLALIQYHRVHPTVLETLQQNGPGAAPWAETLEARLLETRLFETRAWRQKEAEGSRIAAAFAARGFEGLFVKGFALARHVYPVATDRAFGDIDVWVAPGEWRQAAQALSALGYVPKALPRWTEAIGVAFQKEASGDSQALEVDLHWGFVGRLGPQRFLRLDLAAVRSRGILAEPGMRLAKIEDELVLAACHLVRSSFCPLSAFVDLKILVAKEPDWNFVWREASRSSLCTALRAGLELSSALLAYTLPDGAIISTPWPNWQRVFLLPRLAPAKLVRRDRLHEAGARYGLKLVCQDSTARVLGTLFCLPLDLALKSVSALLRRDPSPQ